MRPSFRLILSFLLLAPALFGWVKQGTVSGNITDVEVITWNGTSGLIYAATGGAGVFRTQDGINWIESNGSGTSLLPDYTVKAIASFPGRETWLLAVCPHGVYFTQDKGATWEDFNQGLTAGIPPEVAFPAAFQDIAVGSDGSQYYLYLATLGAGVFRRTGTVSPMPTFTQWVDHNVGDIVSNDHDYFVVSIGANGTRALAGTMNRLTQEGGHLYWLDTTNPPPPDNDIWRTVTATSFPQNATIPAISFRSAEYALVSVGLVPGAGVTYGGVWYTQWTTTPPSFSELDPGNNMPTDQPFLSLDSFFDPVSGTLTAAGGTTEGLWFIPPPDLGLGHYLRIPFKGAVTGVGVGHPQACDVFFGGPGKGPFKADLCNPYLRPVARRNQMTDIQVVDIAVSPGAADDTVFGASRIAGLYKNRETISPCDLNPARGYFTRMAGDPEQENSPDVLCTAISPTYQEGGTVEGGQLTLFAGTNGKGVLRTVDGGRSWTYVNNGLPAGAKVTALAISPRYGEVGYPLAVFAAVYGDGVFVTKNNGLSWTLAGSLMAIGNPYVNTLAIHPNYPSSDVPSLYAGCQADMTLPTTQKTFFVLRETLDEWMAGPPEWSITSLSLGKLSTETHLFAGTSTGGVWISKDDGLNWDPLDNGLPANAFVWEVEASPNYGVEQLVMAAVRPTGVSTQGGPYFMRYVGTSSVWVPVNNGLPDLRVLSLAFDPNFATTGAVYAGHVNQGIFAAKMSYSGPDCAWSASEGFFTTPKRVNGVAVDPTDPDLVFAATDDMGVFVSFDGGFTFRPWSVGLRHVSTLGGETWPVPRTLSIAIAQQPGSGLSRAICGTAGHGIYYNEYNPSVLGALTSSWTAAAMSPETTGDVNEIRVTPEKVLLDESFEYGLFPPYGWSVTNGGSGGRDLTWTDQNPAYNDGMAVCTTRTVSSPLSNLVALMDGDCDGSGAIQDDILETPNLLTSTQGVNTLTLEFDHYFYHFTGYTSQGDVDLYRPSLGGWVTLATYKDAVIPATHVTLDLTPYLEPGMRVRFHYTGAYDGWWMVDNVKVTANQAEDIRASVIDSTGAAAGGDWHSSDYGATWSMVSNLGGAGLADMSFMESSPIVPGRGLAGFVWGCSSGKQVSTRGISGGGRAWQYAPSSGWAACPTPSPTFNPTFVYEDFRAILKLGSGPLLLGSKGVDAGGVWEGLWRSEDACSTWTPSAEGLPDNPQVYALQELDNGDLLAGLDGTSGGVYLSDSSSGGRAWVSTNSGFEPSSQGTVDLATSGTSIYSGMSADGIYADEAVVTYAGPPAAFFEAPARVCTDTAVPFTDFSAGYPTAWSWTFGDLGGSSTDRHPTHIYTAGGTYTVTLTASNAYGADLTPYSRGIEVFAELEVGETLTVTKTSTAGEVRLDWGDIAGEEEYVIWESDDASGARDKVDSVGAGVTTYIYSPAADIYFFRIQPTSTTYFCGDGIIGGSW